MKPIILVINLAIQEKAIEQLRELGFKIVKLRKRRGQVQRVEVLFPEDWCLDQCKGRADITLLLDTKGRSRLTMWRINKRKEYCFSIKRYVSFDLRWFQVVTFGGRVDQPAWQQTHAILNASELYFLNGNNSVTIDDVLLALDRCREEVFRWVDENFTEWRDPLAFWDDYDDEPK